MVGMRPVSGPQLVGCAKCLEAVLVQPKDGSVSVGWAEGVERVEDLAPTGSVMSGVLSSLSDVIAQLPALPQVPQRIVSMVHDPLVSTAEVSEVVGEDPVMSMKILGLANSAYFAARSEINDLKTACSRLGMRGIANIAHAVANGNLYEAEAPEFRQLMQRLWKHAVATAHVADELGRLVKGVDRRQLFIAGLTHDVGKLVLLDALTRKYHGYIGRLRESSTLLVSALDRYAAVAGLHVVQHWKLAPEFTFTTRYLKRPEAVSPAKLRTLVYIVSLGSDIADTCGFAVEEVYCDELLDHRYRAPLGISQAEFAELMNTLPDTLGAMLGILGRL